MDRPLPPKRADYPRLYAIPTRWLDNESTVTSNNVIITATSIPRSRIF